MGWGRAAGVGGEELQAGGGVTRRVATPQLQRGPRGEAPVRSPRIHPKCAEREGDPRCLLPHILILWPRILSLPLPLCSLELVPREGGGGGRNSSLGAQGRWASPPQLPGSPHRPWAALSPLPPRASLGETQHSGPGAKANVCGSVPVLGICRKCPTFKERGAGSRPAALQASRPHGSRPS